MHRSYQKLESQLKRQQQILKVLGFYTGTITGVWDERSIQAMKLFETSNTFKPGIPNHGLPFGDGPYPAGVHVDSKDRNLLTCTELEIAIAAAAKKVEEDKKAAAAKPAVTNTQPKT
jgi:peptidoglycan hydrolase-like protein with peptidoglycan-binding domain